MVNPPRSRGTAWETTVARHAQAAGLPWDRARTLGDHNDLLDISGCLPDGWLVGCKGLTRKAVMSDRIREASAQSARAMAALERLFPGRAADVVPVQVLQKAGRPAGEAYVVLSYDDFLRLVHLRRGTEGSGS